MLWMAMLDWLSKCRPVIWTQSIAILHEVEWTFHQAFRIQLLSSNLRRSKSFWIVGTHLPCLTFLAVGTGTTKSGKVCSQTFRFPYSLHSVISWSWPAKRPHPWGVALRSCGHSLQTGIPSRRPSVTNKSWCNQQVLVGLRGSNILRNLPESSSSSTCNHPASVRLPNSHDFWWSAHNTISVDFACSQVVRMFVSHGFSVPQKVCEEKAAAPLTMTLPSSGNSRLAKVVPQLRSAGVETPLHWNTKNMHPAQRHWLVQYGSNT